MREVARANIYSEPPSALLIEGYVILLAQPDPTLIDDSRKRGRMCDIYLLRGDRKSVV